MTGAAPTLEAELDVYAHRGGVKLLGGKWVPVSATLQGRMLHMKGQKNYDKSMEISPGTCLEIVPTSGRFVLALKGFNGARTNRRLIDFKTQHTLDIWKKEIDAIASKSIARALSIAYNPGVRPKSVRPHAFTSNFVLQTGTEEEDEILMSPNAKFRLSKEANERLCRAIAHVVKQVTEKRRLRSGYTVHELATLNSELLELERRSRQCLKFKVRRILRALAKERSSGNLRERSSYGERAYNVMHAHAEQHGIHLADSRHHEPIIGLHNAKASIVETLPALLEKNRVLHNLVTTLQFQSRKEKLSLHDAVTCIFAGRVIKTLLNISGGLSILLSLPRERNAFRKLCVAALLCRVPVFTTRILELLAALALLPEKVEGYRMVRAVLREVDKHARWGHAVCSSAPLSPTEEARSNELPPAFSALSQLLADGSHELGNAVVSLFTALCNSVHHSQGREAALWLQARIFHAIRVTVPVLKEAESLATGPSRRRASSSAIRKLAPGVHTVEDDGYGGSLCRPLLSVLAQCEAAGDSGGAKIFKITLERFLDSWDARELDEEEQCEVEVPGSAQRVEILASRISRAALLLAHADVDGLLETLGRELEVASVKPIVRDSTDDHPLSLDVHSTVAALHRLQPKEQARETHVASRARPKSMALSVGNLDAMLKKHAALHAAPPPTVPEEQPDAQDGQVALKDDPRYAKFFKMIRLHIPKMAVCLKMSAEGLDPAVLDMNVNEPAPAPEQKKVVVTEVALKDDPKYAKYFKMLRLHIPRPAVENKMRAEGLDPALLNCDPEGPVPSAKKDEPAVPPVESAVPLKDDPTYSKYFKMLKMHVPKMAVAAKMAAESLDSSILDLDPTKPLPRERRGSSPSPGALVEQKPAEPPAHCARPPKTKVRKVFLDLINDGSGTWWKSEDGEVAGEPVLAQDALEELETVFIVPPRKGELASEDAKAAAAAALSDMAQSEVEAAKKRKEVRSLVTEACGSKRAFELSVQFSGIKVHTDDVARALACLDPKGSVLIANPISLSILYEMFIRKLDMHEITKLNELVSKHLLEGNGRLDEVSAFFVGLLRVVRRPRDKVLHLWFRATIEDRANEIAIQVENFENAANAIRDSHSLKQLLIITLALSNFLNYGTPRANVQGVKISSLLKLRQTKTTKSDNCRSLLTYTAKHSGVSPMTLRAELPEDMLSAVYLGLPRPDLKKSILELKDEYEVAQKEKVALARDADTTQEAALIEGAKVAADFVARAGIVIEQLESAFASLEENVDKVLALYGEPPTADVEEWIRDIDRFAAQYEVENKELTDAMNRKRKREALEEKKKKRQTEIEKMQSVRNIGNQGPAVGQINRIVEDMAKGAALEEVRDRPYSRGNSLRSHATNWAQRIRQHTVLEHNDDDEADADDFD